MRTGGSICISRMSRRHREVLLSTFLLLALSGVSFGQTTAEKACAPWATLQVPDADKPKAAQAVSAGTPCSPFVLYHCEGHVPDHLQKARWCALAQLGLFRSGADPVQAKVAQSAVANSTNPANLDQADGLTLAMLFQNGEGVARNTPTAQSLLCQFGFEGPEAEIERMPILLESFGRGERFDLCGKDREPQGRSIGYACTAVDVGKTEIEIGSERAKAFQVLGPAMASALRNLEQARGTLDAQQEDLFNHLCNNGTGCGVLAEQNTLQDDQRWLRYLALLASGTLPDDLPTAGEYAQLDKQFNATYRDLLKERRLVFTDVTDAGEPKVVEQTREVERSWIHFRDAWVRMASQRWPRVPGDRWRAWLTARWLKDMEPN